MSRHTLTLSSFETESGERLTNPQIAYRTWGQLNEDQSNAVVICHALTGSPDADEWLPGLFGPGNVFDPDRDYIICANVFGGCYGSTGPLSVNPDTGQPYKADFPELTVRDLVRQQQALLDHLGVRRIRFVFGGSMGGMQALEFGIMDSRVERMVLIAMGKAHSAWAIGMGEVQRNAIMTDPKWNDGYYDPEDPPAYGLATARMQAMLSYRTHESFRQRFDREVQDNNRQFQVESYLNYQGDKLVSRFDANTYIRLTRIMDSHDVGRDRPQGTDILSGVTQPALVIGIDSDILYPTREQKDLADRLPNGIYRELQSDAGHDGFLIEFDQVKDIVSEFLSKTNNINAYTNSISSHS